MTSTSQQSTSSRRTMEGVVVAKSGDKTVKIEIVRRLQHPLYRKQVRRTKRYLVHDPRNEVSVGQVITVRESRPISKSKRWTVVYPAVKA